MTTATKTASKTAKPGARPNYVSTTNACKLCKPLGAALAFKGIEGCVPFLHGSQGCATYMRRYIISHFREPVDIASSALGEKQAIYGGGPNLKKGLLNVLEKYGATCVGVASTCLTETIGDDVGMLLGEFYKEFGDLDLPPIVHVSTPSYSGTHMEGFHAAVKATVAQLAQPSQAHEGVNLFPGMVSPEDIRHLRELFAAFGLSATILPDYSDTLDGPALEDYEKIPSGGTPVADIRRSPGARASIECGHVLQHMETAGTFLQSKFGVPLTRIGMPIGIRESDRLAAALGAVSGQAVPEQITRERGRLVDALVDGHKYVSGKRAIVYGEDDFVVAMTGFLAEIGVKPVLVASGGTSRHADSEIREVTKEFMRQAPTVRMGVDFYEIAEEAEGLAPELIVGNSKGYKLARALNIPLIRCGFPIHDRFGAQRMLHVGYRGAQSLFDRIVNAVIEKKQADSDVGYGYL